MHPVRRPHLHLPPRAAPQRRFPPSAAHTPQSWYRASGSTVRPHSPTNASHVERRCNHVDDILPVNAAGAARSFRQNDMPKRNLARDPREIRSTGVVMTNGGSSPVRIARQVGEGFFLFFSQGARMSLGTSRWESHRLIVESLLRKRTRGNDE